MILKIILTFSPIKDVCVKLQAYQIGMYGPKYVWFLPGFYDNIWLTANLLENTPCTMEQVEQVMEGTFYAGQHYFSYVTQL